MLMPLTTGGVIQMHDNRRQVMGLMGLPMDRLTLQEATDKVRKAARENKRLFLSTPNLNFLMGCQTDLAFRLSVIDSDLSTADGMPLIWMSRWLGAPLPERVTGSTIFEKLENDVLAPGELPLRVYFFGGPDGAAEQAAEKLSKKTKNMVCAGFSSPGFGSVDALSAPHFIDHINASQADILVVAMGAVKGQAWLQKNRAVIHVPVISHLGAVINFAAGTVLRAPLWVQRTGLEWMWRIKEEPALWRRYWQDGLAFGDLFARQLMPYMVWTWLRKWRPTPQTAQMRFEQDDERGQVVRLSGAWRAQAVEGGHAGLDRIKKGQGSVTVNLTDVEDMGTELAGELLELCRCLRAQERPLHVVAGHGVARRLLDWNGLNFLLVKQGTAR
jgi:N-acetylglucosaminyldiphosphoundecaprenol N-acetyl-beta-D-mannosaminyltransferase